MFRKSLLAHGELCFYKFLCVSWQKCMGVVYILCKTKHGAWLKIHADEICVVIVPKVNIFQNIHGVVEKLCTFCLELFKLPHIKFYHRLRSVYNALTIIAVCSDQKIIRYHYVWHDVRGVEICRRTLIIIKSLIFFMLLCKVTYERKNIQIVFCGVFFV